MHHGVLTEMQIVNPGEGIPDRNGPREHRRQAALERTPLGSGPELLQKQGLVVSGAEAEQPPELERKTHQKKQRCHPKHPLGRPAVSLHNPRAGVVHAEVSIGPSSTRARSNINETEP